MAKIMVGCLSAVCVLFILCCGSDGANRKSKHDQDWIVLGPGVLLSCKRIDLIMHGRGYFSVVSGTNNFDFVSTWIADHFSTKLFGNKLRDCVIRPRTFSRFTPTHLDLYRGESAASEDLLICIPLDERMLKDAESLQQEIERLKSKMTPIQTTPLGSDRTDDYEKPLCGNYRIVRTNANEVIIDNPKLPLNVVIVGKDKSFDASAESSSIGNVRQLAVKAPYVSGYATVLHGDNDPHARTGYFLIDTATDRIKGGLTEQEWHAELERIAWPHPELVPPE